jgi:hypothetical protein
MEQPRDLQIPIGLDDMYALFKTVGIAIDNLNKKINKHGTHTAIGVEALADHDALLRIQAEIIRVMREEVVS